MTAVQVWEGDGVDREEIVTKGRGGTGKKIGPRGWVMVDGVQWWYKFVTEQGVKAIDIREEAAAKGTGPGRRGHLFVADAHPLGLNILDADGKADFKAMSSADLANLIRDKIARNIFWQEAT